MKIIKPFLFMNELDLLKIQFEELYDVVDYFIIIQSEISFQGNIQPFYGCFEKNQNLFDKYMDKTIVFNLDKTMFPPLNFPHPQYRRNWIYENLKTAVNEVILDQGLQGDDLVLFGDCDEIPNKEVIKSLKNTKLKLNEYKVLQMDLYYFYFNYRLTNMKWNGYKLTNIDTFMNTHEIYHTIRQAHDWNPQYSSDAIPNAGWHYSYFGGEEKIIHKINSLSHIENKTDKIMDINNIRTSMKTGKDIFGRDNHKWIIEDIIEDINQVKLPSYVRNNLEKYNKGFNNG